MAEHKFKIGRLVYFQPARAIDAPPGHYQIIRRLPESPDGEFHYVIRSTHEDHERAISKDGTMPIDRGERSFYGKVFRLGTRHTLLRLIRSA